MAKRGTQRPAGGPVGAVVAVVVGFVAVLGALLGVRALANLGYEPVALAAGTAAGHSASLTLENYPDSYPCHGSATGFPFPAPVHAYASMIMLLGRSDSSTRS